MGSKQVSGETDGVTYVCSDAVATRTLGQALGRLLARGDVLALEGPLGSGKTTFTQGLAQGLGVAADRAVTSPTFALVNEHPGRVPLVHADLYRIENQSELDELGLEEAYERSAAALEWADRFPGVLPEDHLQVIITPAEAAPPGTSLPGSTRRMAFFAHGPRSERLLTDLVAALPTRPLIPR